MSGRFATVLTSVGFTRDMRAWLWLRILSASALLASLSSDSIHKGLSFVGLSIPDVWVHRVLAASVALLWIAGKQDRSDLPSTAEKESVNTKELTV